MLENTAPISSQDEPTKTDTERRRPVKRPPTKLTPRQRRIAEKRDIEMSDEGRKQEREDLKTYAALGEVYSNLLLHLAMPERRRHLEDLKNYATTAQLKLLTKSHLFTDYED